METKHIDTLTERAKDYTKMFGRCAKCDAPVWYMRTVDDTGTPMLAYHCGNGHYETLRPQLLDIYDRDSDVSDSRYLQ